MSLTLSCAHHQLNLAQPKVMGIINLHDQSYSATGRVTTPSEAIAYAKQLIQEGADIIDLGAEPTNPYITHTPSIEEEISALLPVIRDLIATTKVIISVDTSQAEVMQAVIQAGAHMINDVRALTLPGALEVIAHSSVGVCLMHHLAVADDVPLLRQINDDLQARVDACIAAGISAERICIDPGVGGGNDVFHKTDAAKRHLLQHLSACKVTPTRPLLIGVSRKGFIGRWMSPSAPVAEHARLPGSLAAALWAVSHGAHIIRTHDVAATKQAMQLWSLLQT